MVNAFAAFDAAEDPMAAITATTMATLTAAEGRSLRASAPRLTAISAANDSLRAAFPSRRIAFSPIRERGTRLHAKPDLCPRKHSASEPRNSADDFTRGRCGARCLPCIRRGTPCVVTEKFGTKKRDRCDGCVEHHDECSFAPPLLLPPPLKLARNCANCQRAHQRCKFDTRNDACIRCRSRGLACEFKPCAQGQQNNILRVAKRRRQRGFPTEASRNKRLQTAQHPSSKM